jgi:hypothetical protein
MTRKNHSFLPQLHVLRRLGVLLVLLSMTCVAAGCVALAIGGAAAGAGGGDYAKVNKKRTYNDSMDDVSQAALNALAELELNVAHADHDQLKGRIDAYTATGDHVKINLENLGQATELAIRVNTFGDNSMSHMILDKIDQYLPQSTQPSGIATSQPLPETAQDQPQPPDAEQAPLQVVQPAAGSEAAQSGQ